MESIDFTGFFSKIILKIRRLRLFNGSPVTTMHNFMSFNEYYYKER